MTSTPMVNVLAFIAAVVAAPAGAQGPAAAAPDPGPSAVAPVAAPAPTASTLAAPGATCSGDDCISDASKGRTLNDHRFMPTATVPQPFATTNLVSYLVIALGNTTGSARVGDQVFSGSFDYAGIGGVIGYEHSFLDDHLSARALITNFIYSGINGSSALVVGSEMQVGFGVGVTANVSLGDSMKLGLLVDVNETPNLALTVASGISTIVNTCRAQQPCNIDPEQIFGTTTATTIEPTIAWSWAPLRPLGVTGAATYIHADYSGKLDGSGDAMQLAGAVDFDFLAISSTPIGLTAQFAWTAPFAGHNLQHVTDVGGGIWYTGRKDLAAGLQFVARRFAVAPNTDVSWGTQLATLGLRYYWK